MSKTLITDALVLTVDTELGTLPRGDVLIDGSRIAALGVDLPREGGVEIVDGRNRIVMPGFVDTHRHMWAAMLRGCACYGDLGTYFHDVVFTYGANFTPQDTYTSVRFGLAEAIECSQPVRHVTAASACNGETGGEIRDGKLRQQEGYHHGLGNLVTPQPLVTSMGQQDPIGAGHGSSV